MIQVADHPAGCVVAVRAQPGAKRNAVVGEQASRLKVAVTAPADQGKANRALVDVLADALGLKRSQVELRSGPAQREKKFLLRGVTADQARALLHAILPNSA